MAGEYVEINGTSRPMADAAVSLSLKQRSTATVTLIDKTSTYTVREGQRIEIGNGSRVIFGGTVANCRPIWYPPTTLRKFALTCVSFEQIAARRSTGQRHYDVQPAGAIFRDLVTNCLTGEGINVDDVLDGPDVGPFDFDYATVEEAFDAVAAAAGYYWDITYALHLRFFSRTTYSAPWSITATSANVLNIGTIEAESDRAGLANRAYVRIGQYLGDMASEVFVGDGAATSFDVLQPIGAQPTVTLNAAAQTVGILGVDTGKDWYWNVGSNTITQDSGGTVLTGSDSLQVDYLPVSSQVVLGHQDNDAIDDRATLEGLSGIYDVVLEANTPTTRQAAEAYATAYVEAHKAPTVSLAVETREDDLDVGMSMDVNLPGLDVDDTFLIEELQYSVSREQGAKWRAQMSTGALQPTWEQVFTGGGTGQLPGLSTVAANTEGIEVRPVHY